MADLKNPYEVLGVSKSATTDDIRAAYRKLARRYHPDLNPGNKEAETRFKEINFANEQIGTPEARARYDRGEFERMQPPPGAAGRRPFYYETQGEPGSRYSARFTESVDPEFFENLFSGLGGGAFREAHEARYRMVITPREAVHGGEREMGLPDGRRIRVRIPKGVTSGQRLRVQGVGELELEIQAGAGFRIEGADLVQDLPVSLGMAVLGGETQIQTVDGPVRLRIPKGVSSGQRLRLRGKGLIDPETGTRGDQLCELRIVLPERIDPELEEAVRRWSERHPEQKRYAA